MGDILGIVQHLVIPGRKISDVIGHKTVVTDFAITDRQISVLHEVTRQIGHLRDKRGRSAIGVAVVVDTRSRSMHAGQDRGARRAANRGIVVGISKPGAARRQPLHVWRWHRTVLGDVREIGRMIVDHDDQDIRPVWRRRGAGRRKRPETTDGQRTGQDR